jgi:spore coat polysaccharide biosynthesis protein SpsF
MKTTTTTTTAAIIQARLGSTRLPGKVLMPLGGRPALDHVIERVTAAKTVDLVVIATTLAPGDDPIADYCARNGIACVRGSEDDVLSRYLDAMRLWPSDIVVRITADCPLTDPALIDDVVAALKADATLDYHSNTLPPRRIPHGLDVEAFRRAVLERAGREATRADEREHVTPYIHRHPELFRITQAILPKDISGCRLTLDTQADWDLLNLMLTALPSGEFGWQASIALLETHPDWVRINAAITQKSLTP